MALFKINYFYLIMHWLVILRISSLPCDPATATAPPAIKLAHLTHTTASPNLYHIIITD